MVGLSLHAAGLMAEEAALDQEIATRASPTSQAPPAQAPPAQAPTSQAPTSQALSAPAPATAASAPPLAQAQVQTAAQLQGGGAVASAGQRVRELRDGLAFPEFVTNLITGVFQAISTSSPQQLQAVADLLEAVDMSAADFGSQQVGQDRAVQWAMGRFGVFVIDRSNAEQPRLVLGPDRNMPESAALQAALEATEDEVSTVDEDDLSGTLLPLVRRKLGRDRQKMLSTMLLMGLQRVVVDEGRLHASMDMRVDARSIAEQRHQEQFDTRVSTAASASVAAGPWGASASVQASVGFVRADDEVTREDIQASAGLRSSVDLAFRTEPFSLERMAGSEVRARLSAGSMAPSWERGQQQGGPGSQNATTTRTDLNAANPQHNLAVPTAPPPPGERSSDSSSPTAGSAGATQTQALGGWGRPPVAA